MLLTKQPPLIFKMPSRRLTGLFKICVIKVLYLNDIYPSIKVNMWKT